MKTDYRETRWHLALHLLGYVSLGYLAWAALYAPETLRPWVRPLALFAMWATLAGAAVEVYQSWRTRREVSNLIRAHRWARPFREEDDR